MLQRPAGADRTARMHEAGPSNRPSQSPLPHTAPGTFKQGQRLAPACARGVVVGTRRSRMGNFIEKKRAWQSSTSNASGATKGEKTRKTRKTDGEKKTRVVRQPSR